MKEGWKALSVQWGYTNKDSVVTVAMGWSYISCVVEVETRYPPQILLIDYINFLSSVCSSALLFADPLVSRILHYH